MNKIKKLFTLLLGLCLVLTIAATAAPTASAAGTDYKVLVWTNKCGIKRFLPDGVKEAYAMSNVKTLAGANSMTSTVLEGSGKLAEEVAGGKLSDKYDIIFVYVPVLNIADGDAAALEAYMSDGGRVVFLLEYVGYNYADKDWESTVAPEVSAQSLVTYLNKTGSTNISISVANANEACYSTNADLHVAPMFKTDSRILGGTNLASNTCYTDAIFDGHSSITVSGATGVETVASYSTSDFTCNIVVDIPYKNGYLTIVGDSDFINSARYVDNAYLATYKNNTTTQDFLARLLVSSYNSLHVEAKIGTTTYNSLKTAIGAASSGQTVEMMKKPKTAVTAARLVKGAALKDLNGCTYTAENPITDVSVDTDGNVTLTAGKVTVDRPTDATKDSTIVVNWGATVIGESGLPIMNAVSGVNITVVSGAGEDTVTIPSGGKAMVNASTDDERTFEGCGPTGTNTVIKVSQNEGTPVYKLTSGPLQLADGESITGSSGRVITNPADSGDDKISVAASGTQDTVTIPAENGTADIGGNVYTAAAANTALQIANVSSDPVKLTSGAVTLTANGAPVGVADATCTIAVPAGKQDVTISKTGTGTCTAAVASGGEVKVTVGTTTCSYVNKSKSAVNIPIGTGGAIGTTLNDTGVSTNLPTGESYEGYSVRTVDNVTTWTFEDDLDSLLAKENTKSGDVIVLNTAKNPTTEGYVLTTNGIDIYTAQGNLAKSKTRIDVKYTDGYRTVDARERAAYYGLSDDTAGQLKDCMVVKVSNEDASGKAANGFVQVQAGEAKIKWSDTDTTYYVTLADAVYDASHDASEGTTVNQYNTHDGREKSQTIEMTINPYENRENLVLEAGDKLVIRGEDAAKTGDSYTGVTLGTDGTEAPADVTISMYAGSNDVYVTSGTLKVENNQNTDAGNEANGFADACVGSKSGGYYAKTTNASDVLYVTAGNTTEGIGSDGSENTGNRPAYVTTTCENQTLAIGVGAGYVNYTGTAKGSTFPITQRGRLDADGEKVVVKESEITSDYTLFTVLSETDTQKIIVKDTDTADGSITIENDMENEQAVVTCAKTGEKLEVGSAYTVAEDNTVLTVKKNTGKNDPTDKYVTTLTQGAVKMDRDGVIYEDAADVKIKNTSGTEGKLITVETASVNTNDGKNTGVIVTVPAGGCFEVYDKDGSKTGLNGVTVTAESKFFVGSDGHITLLSGTVEIASEGSLNLGSNDEKITNTNTDGSLTVTAVRTDGTATEDMSAFENGTTTAEVSIPAGKTADFDRADGKDSQSYLNPTKKPDGSTDTNSLTNDATTITVLPNGKRVVTCGDVELDMGENIYVTNKAYMRATSTAAAVPTTDADLALVTGTGKRNIQVSYGNGDAQNLMDPDPSNTITVPEKGEAKITVNGKDRYFSVPDNGDDLDIRTLEGALDSENELLISIPKRTYPDVFASVGLKSADDSDTDQIAYGNRSNSTPTLLAVDADGVVYAKKGAAAVDDEGDIILDIGENVNVKLNEGYANIKNTAADAKKTVTVGKETTGSGKNPVTVAQGGSVTIEGVELDISGMSETTQFDIVKDGGNIEATVPAGETLKINGKDYEAAETAKLEIIPEEKHSGCTADEIKLISGRLLLKEGQAVTLNSGMQVENRGPKAFEISSDGAMTIPAGNKVLINGVEIAPTQDSAVSINANNDPVTLNISVPAGGSVTVDGVVYTESNNNLGASLSISASTGTLAGGDASTTFNTFSVSAPDGLQDAREVTLPNGTKINRDAQSFTVPSGKSITVGDRSYEPVGEAAITVAANGTAKDPLVTVANGKGVKVTENKQISGNPADDTEKAVNTYTNNGDIDATAVFTGDRDDIDVKSGTLELTASNVWHTVKLSGVTGTTEVVKLWNTETYENALKDITTTRSGYTFGGWYLDSSYTRSVDTSDKILEDCTLYAKWTKKTGTLSCTVKNDAAEPAAVVGATVKLLKGSTEYKSETTDEEGSFSISDIPEGTYQLVVSNSSDAAVTTALVTVDADGAVTIDGSADNTVITLRNSNTAALKSSKVTLVGDKTPDVAVGGLDALAEADTSNSSVCMELVVESDSPATPEAEKTAIQTEAGNALLDYIRIDAFKTIDSSTREPIKETNSLLTIVIPFQTSGRTNFAVYRYHNSAVDKLTTTANADGERIVVGDNQITIYANKFSTYAISYTTVSSSGGNSGGSGSTTGEISVGKTANGSVSVSPENAARGKTVTITTIPDKGWTLETLTVLDENGNELELETVEIGGKYTFRMPSGNVTVKATFMEDNTMLNYFVDVNARDYFYDAVLWAVENGITDGTDDSHFSPDGVCTRAQAVTFLWRAAGCPEPETDEMPFVDVPKSAYYYDAVLWAMEKGITVGTSDTTFSPDMYCSRAHIVTFLWRAEGSKAAGTVNPFTDVKESAYYADAVLWAVKESITNGTTDTTFSPDDDCLRSQIVTFIWRALAE